MRALIFDLDGTLVDTVYAHVFAWQQALTEADLPIDAWRVHRRIGMSGGLFTRAIAREIGRPLGPDQVNALQNRHSELFRTLLPSAAAAARRGRPAAPAARARSSARHCHVGPPAGHQSVAGDARASLPRPWSWSAATSCARSPSRISSLPVRNGSASSARLFRHRRRRVGSAGGAPRMDAERRSPQRRLRRRGAGSSRGVPRLPRRARARRVAGRAGGSAVATDSTVTLGHGVHG